MGVTGGDTGARIGSGGGQGRHEGREGAVVLGWTRHVCEEYVFEGWGLGFGSTLNLLL